MKRSGSKKKVTHRCANNVEKKKRTTTPPEIRGGGSVNNKKVQMQWIRSILLGLHSARLEAILNANTH